MRILFVSRYYPPEISGGARRPFALVHALRQLGVDVTICAPSGIEDPDKIEVPHPIFPATLPNQIDDIATTSPDLKPSAQSRVFNWARRNLLLPDPEIRWALRVVDFVARANKSFDWVVTSSPPESLHVAGALIKRRLGIKWAADVRDLWITSPQRRELERNPLRAWFERRIARWCFRRLDALVGVSPAVLDEMRLYAPQTVMMCEIGHFAMPYEGEPEALPGECFNIVHTGSVELSNPLSDFDALLSDFERAASRFEHVRLWLAGRLSERELACIASSPVASKIIVLGPVDMVRARALQVGSDALALVSGVTSHALPGKFCEYLLSGKPILLSARGKWCDLIPSHARIVDWDAIDEVMALPRSTPSEISEPSSATRAAQALVTFLSEIDSK